MTVKIFEVNIDFINRMIRIRKKDRMFVKRAIHKIISDQIRIPVFLEGNDFKARAAVVPILG